MDIETLKAKGAFIQVPPVPVEATWTHPDENGEEVTDTFTVHCRRMAVGWLDRVFAMYRTNPTASRTAVIISEGIFFGEGGKEKLTYDQAAALDWDLSKALVKAFNKVQENPVKNSQPPTSSGTN
jgi:hypothetical protein